MACYNMKKSNETARKIHHYVHFKYENVRRALVAFNFKC